jgi:heme/copper-type cytochrome/quinol oxidase subunit 2
VIRHVLLEQLPDYGTEGTFEARLTKKERLNMEGIWILISVLSVIVIVLAITTVALTLDLQHLRKSNKGNSTNNISEFTRDAKE